MKYLIVFTSIALALCIYFTALDLAFQRSYQQGVDNGYELAIAEAEVTKERDFEEACSRAKFRGYEKGYADAANKENNLREAEITELKAKIATLFAAKPKECEKCEKIEQDFKYKLDCISQDRDLRVKEAENRENELSERLQLEVKESRSLGYDEGVADTEDALKGKLLIEYNRGFADSRQLHNFMPVPMEWVRNQKRKLGEMKVVGYVTENPVGPGVIGWVPMKAIDRPHVLRHVGYAVDGVGEGNHDRPFYYLAVWNLGNVDIKEIKGENSQRLCK